MCRAFTPDSRHDNCTTNLTGDVYCTNTDYSGKFSLHNKTFQSLGGNDYQCRQFASVCQVRNFFEDQKNSFSLMFGHGVYILEESLKSIQDVVGDVYCPDMYCLKREKCKFCNSYVTTPRTISGRGKCGVRLFVHKVPFKLQEHVKTIKIDKTRFFMF